MTLVDVPHFRVLLLYFGVRTITKDPRTDRGCGGLTLFCGVALPTTSNRYADYVPFDYHCEDCKFYNLATGICLLGGDPELPLSDACEEFQLPEETDYVSE
jgi:hypothetical protein